MNQKNQSHVMDFDNLGRRPDPAEYSALTILANCVGDLDSSNIELKIHKESGRLNWEMGGIFCSIVAQNRDEVWLAAVLPSGPWQDRYNPITCDGALAFGQVMADAHYRLKECVIILNQISAAVTLQHFGGQLGEVKRRCFARIGEGTHSQWSYVAASCCRTPRYT